VAVNDRLGRTRWKHEGPTRGDSATPEYESYDDHADHAHVLRVEGVAGHRD
jgi:hypothetical protein